MPPVPQSQTSPFPAFAPERVLLGLDDLARLGVRISRSTAWRWFHSKRMPMPAKLTGARNERLYWWSDVIAEWLRARRAERGLRFRQKDLCGGIRPALMEE